MLVSRRIFRIALKPVDSDRSRRDLFNDTPHRYVTLSGTLVNPKNPRKIGSRARRDDFIADPVQSTP